MSLKFVFMIDGFDDKITEHKRYELNVKATRKWHVV